MKAFAARRATLTQPSVRPAVTEARHDDPEGFAYCALVGAKVNDVFCRNCKEYRGCFQTRALCKALNRGAK